MMCLSMNDQVSAVQLLVTRTYCTMLMDWTYCTLLMRQVDNVT